MSYVSSSLYGNIGDVLSKLDSIDIPHDSKYHKESVGAHIKAAYALATKRAGYGQLFTTSPVEYSAIQGAYLMELALLHDIGKFKTKSFISEKNGTKLDYAHFYGHENVGAYDSLFYATDIPSYDPEDNSDNKLRRALLINLHMQIHTVNSLSGASRAKAMLKLKRTLADDTMYEILEDFALIDDKARVI